MGEEKKGYRPLSIVCGAVIDKDKILLIKRTQYPYVDYWCMPGGKMKFGEQPEQTGLREIKEETNLDCESQGLKGIASEIVYENGQEKAHFIIFVCKLKPLNDKIIASDEGELQWFDLDELDELKIIPSDLLMIQEFVLKENKAFFKIKMIEENGKYSVEEFKE